MHAVVASEAPLRMRVPSSHPPPRARGLDLLRTQLLKLEHRYPSAQCLQFFIEALAKLRSVDLRLVKHSADAV